MTRTQRRACNLAIHTASAACGAVGAGLAQLPCSDNLVISPIQLTMTLSLAKTFGLAMDEATAKAAIASATATTIGRAASQVGIGWLPGYGNAVNAVTAAAVTETIGWIIASDFERQAA